MKLGKLFLLILLSVSCVGDLQEAINDSTPENEALQSDDVQIASVELRDDQLVISGKDFSSVENASIDGKKLNIISKTDNQIILRASQTVMSALGSPTSSVHQKI